jgi:hypothetical protein
LPLVRWSLLLVIVGVAGGCRSGGVSSPAKGRSGAGQALDVDENGRVDRAVTGTTAIRGRWFASADTEDCQRRGRYAPGQCSMLITPDPHSPTFPPTLDLGMCAIGVAGKVIVGANGRMDWNNIYGARIGLLLAEDGPYDAVAHGVTGFSFHIDTEPPPAGGLRVEVSTEATEPRDASCESSQCGDPRELAAPFLQPWWGGAAGETSPVHAGYNEFRWVDVGGPIYIDSPPPFDPTRLLSLSFYVPSTSSGFIAFSFCISHLTALTN